MGSLFPLRLSSIEDVRFGRYGKILTEAAFVVGAAGVQRHALRSGTRGLALQCVFLCHGVLPIWVVNTVGWTLLGAVSVRCRTFRHGHVLDWANLARRSNLSC